MRRSDIGRCQLPVRVESDSVHPPQPSISNPIGPVRRSNGGDLRRGESLILVRNIDSCADILPAQSSLHSPEIQIQPAARIPLEKQVDGLGPVTHPGQQDTCERTENSQYGSCAMYVLSGAVHNPSHMPSIKSHGFPVPPTAENGIATLTRAAGKQSGTPRQEGLEGATQGHHGTHIMATALEMPLEPNACPAFRANLTEMDIRTPEKRGDGRFVDKVKNTTSSLRKKRYPIAPVPKTRLPKSKTMAVLSNWTASLSRVSLSSDRKVSASSNTSKASSSSLNRTVSNLPRTPTSVVINRTKTAYEPTLADPDSIHDAQPSAYWSGRFTGLNDRLLCETRLSEQSMREMLESKQTSRPNRNYPVARPGIPQSNTTAALTTLTNFPSASFSHPISVSNPLSTAPEDFSGKHALGDVRNEEECRALAIFEHLRNMCATDEALDSLWCWQQDYARKHLKASLLPPGGSLLSLNSKMSGVLAKFLGHKSLSRTQKPQPGNGNKALSDRLSRSK